MFKLLEINLVCKKDEFYCQNRHCIYKEFLCNGVDDCGDNSDENNCNLSSKF